MTKAELCETTAVDAAKVSRVRKRFLDDETARALAETYQALSDPTRVKIVPGPGPGGAMRPRAGRAVAGRRVGCLPPVAVPAQSATGQIPEARALRVLFPG
jgi:hypothetical protein